MIIFFSPILNFKIKIFDYEKDIEHCVWKRPEYELNSQKLKKTLILGGKEVVVIKLYKHYVYCCLN